MAAYGTLLSLTNTIDQIQNHPRPPISLDKLQIQPLIEKVAFLQDFLENYIIDDVNGLEGRMVDAAHAAEGIIESHIANHIDPIIKDENPMDLFFKNMMVESYTSHEAKDNEARGKANIFSKKNFSLYGELQIVMHNLECITEDVAAIKHKKTGKKIAPSCTEDDAMVGSDDVKNDIMDKLTNSRHSEGDDTMVGSNDFMIDVIDKLTNEKYGHWIIAIAGMGGVGKTTLAKSIYENRVIVRHFDIRGWATVSQEFDSERILLQLLHCFTTIGSEGSEHEELGYKLYQSLFGRRYLIVMDDIWGTDAWDGVKPFFPVNNNGSRVLITTRLSNVALQLDGPDYFQMSLLNHKKSWNLLRGCVFGEQGCPPELEGIGKDIARKCKGLPLSIVVIGGLLAKSEQTRQNWLNVLKNLSSIVNLEEDERCLRILKLSYNQLPVHLKPCFLYMGMFPEEHEIHVSTLIRLWVAEGFVKPVAGKSLETIARFYLHDLVLRNLIFVCELDTTRRIKRCGIYNLLRDLCMKEAEKYKFFRTMETTHNPEHHQSWHAQRRIGIHQAEKYIPRPLPKAVQSASRARTLIWNVDGFLPSLVPFRLLRILNGFIYNHKYDEQEFFLPVNLCHLVAPGIQFPVQPLYRLWNLQTLKVDSVLMGKNKPAVLDIWQMSPQLRHVKVRNLQLKDPPPMKQESNSMVLEKLETLQEVLNLRLGEKVVDRIPNIKKLGLIYEDKEEEELSPADYGLDYLCLLRKLEDLSCRSYLYRQVEMKFPVSLRKLTLCGTRLGWEEMGTKIGSLPYLEALKLWYDAFVGPNWETAEGGFQRLKYLTIIGCFDLEQWRAEAEHFPCLQRLHLVDLCSLKEIPLGIADIHTLREINLDYCSDSTVLSAKKILEERLGEFGLQIKVSPHKR
ncbi:disease resistance protein [Striga asiatica]|uniref:Disease resistance protein n=1 Tax=Striga asiatica TaxID=4170 RepID=A0A5A7R8D0_STRAF|nr:disease resistance protein [Striga asiatica]